MENLVMTGAGAEVFRFQSRIPIFILCFTGLFGLSAAGQSDGDYRSAATGSWNDAATWERYDGSMMSWLAAAVPPDNTSGAIAIRSGHEVTVNSVVTADQITVETGGTLVNTQSLQLDNGAGDDLVVNGTLDHRGGSIGLNGSIRIPSGGVFMLTTGNSKSILDPVVNDGTLQWTDGHVITFANSGATLTNNNTFTFSSSLTFQDQGGTGSVINNGSMTKTGAGTTTFVSEHISNTGTFSVQAGTFDILGSGTFTNSGSIVLNNATFSITSSFIHAPGGVFSGTGNLICSGTLTLDTDLNLTASILATAPGTSSMIQGAGNLILNQDFTLEGTIQGTGNLTINGNTTWNSGILDRTFTNQAGRTLTITTSAPKYLRAPLINEGTTLWNAGNFIFIQSDGSSMTNNGSFTISANDLLQDNGGPGIITNNGTIQKTGGGTTTITHLSINNAGTIQLQAGLIYFQGTNAWNNAGTLNFSGGTLTVASTFNHNAGSVIQGSGSINITGILNLNIDLNTPAGIYLSAIGTNSFIQGPGHLTLHQDFILEGTIQGTGNLTVNGNTTWNSGNLDRTFTNASGRTLTLATSATKNLKAPLINNGTLLWSDGLFLFYQSDGSSLVNNGTYTIANNSTWQDNGGISNVTNNGILVKTSTGTTNIIHFNLTNAAGGSLKGQGIIAFAGGGTFTNNGILAPGQSPGILQIQDRPPLTSNSTLQIEVNGNGGPGASNGHDQLLYNSSLTLAGSLVVTETDTTVSDTFTILSLTSGTLSGSFSSVMLPDNYTLLTTANTVKVIKQVLAIYCPGDTMVNTTAGMCSRIINGLDPYTDPVGMPYIYQLSGATTATGNGSVSGWSFNTGLTTVRYKLQQDTSIQCTFLVTVSDNEFPSISCPEDMEVDSGTVVNYTVTSSDNCSGATLMQTTGLPSGSVFPVGLTTNTFVVTDGAGQSASCSFQVSVLGGPPPVPGLMCPGDTTGYTAAGNCSQVINGLEAVTDPPGAEYSFSLSGATTGSGSGSAGGQEFNKGVTTVMYSLTLNPGVQCSFTITVTDTIAPSVSCPQNITLNTDPAICGHIYTYSVTYTDNCSTAMISQTMGIASGDTFPVGITTNTFLITDADGNSTTCSFTVTVEDHEAPSVTCPADIAADINEVVTYSVTYEDQCSGAMLTQTAGLPSGSVFPEGSTTNSFLVEDASGNSAVCSFIVTVSPGGGQGDTAVIGKVGINTLVPAAMLHVKDSSVVFTGASALSGGASPAPINGPGVRMMWYPQRAAFRVGQAYGSEWNRENIGAWTLASGYGVKASATFSVAAGVASTASGTAALAMGNASIASGYTSVALGTSSMASGNSSFAAGYFTKALANAATAFGGSTMALNIADFAAGNATAASGGSSTALGFFSMSKGPFSFASGNAVRAHGPATFAIGMYNDTIIGVQTETHPETPLFIVGNGNYGARSNAMVVRFDGKTGIGTSIPERRLHVRNGISGATSNASAVGVFENNGNAAINILSPDNNSSGIYFGNTQNSAHGGILYNSSTPFGLSFRVNGNSTKMVITSNGNIGMGTISPARKLEIAGEGLQALRISSNNSVQAALELKRSGAGHDWRIINSGGLLLLGQSTNDLASVTEVVRLGGSSMTPASDNAVTLGNASLRWTQVWAVNGMIQTSDARDKENITDITSGLSRIMQLQPVTYHWKDACIDMQKPHLGFIAQELQAVVPEAVVTHEWQETPDGAGAEWKATDKLGVNYSELVPLLTKAIQEQQVLLEKQQATIDLLLQRIEVLEAEQTPVASIGPNQEER